MIFYLNVSTTEVYAAVARGKGRKRVAGHPATSMNDLAAENVHLRNLLTDVVVAVDRLIDNWAESDAAVRKRLWRHMAAATQAAADMVYPLDSGDGLQPVLPW